MSSNAAIAQQPTMTLAQKFKAQKAAALKRAMENEEERERVKQNKKNAKEAKAKAILLKKENRAQRKEGVAAAKKTTESKYPAEFQTARCNKRKAKDGKGQEAKKSKIEESTKEPTAEEVKETDDEKRMRLAIEKEKIISPMIMPLFHRPTGHFGPYIPRPEWMDAPEEEEGEYPLRDLGKTWSWFYNERVHHSDHKAGYIPRAVRSETYE